MAVKSVELGPLDRNASNFQADASTVCTQHRALVAVKAARLTNVILQRCWISADSIHCTRMSVSEFDNSLM